MAIGTTELLLILICAMLLTAIVMLAVLLGRQDRTGARNEKQLNDLGNALLDELDDQHDASAAAQQAFREQAEASLHRMGQSQSALLESMQRQILLSTGNQETRFQQMAQTMDSALGRQDQRLAALADTNARQLEEMRRTVDEKLSETLDRRLTESFSQVSRRLEQVYKGLGEMQTLAAGVGDLKKVFSNVKTRGIWGEAALGTLLADALAPEQYAENVAVIPGAAERVEFAIRLPGRADGPVWLPVDSKFPQEDYIRMTEAAAAGDRAAEDAARKQLAARIRTEAKRISSKYLQPPHTTDFAVMFLPIEGIYAEAVRDMDLVAALQREQRIILSGPTTFSALLNSLQLGFRTLAIEQRSAEIWKLLGTVKTDFGRFGEALDKARRQLTQAGETLDAAYTKTRTIERRLGAVEELGLPAAGEGTDNANAERAEQQ